MKQGILALSPIRLYQTIKNLQYRYFDEVTNRYRGGLVVSEAIQQRSAALMFR